MLLFQAMAAVAQNMGGLAATNLFQYLPGPNLDYLTGKATCGTVNVTSVGDSGLILGLRQRQTVLFCNYVSHWLGTNLAFWLRQVAKSSVSVK